MFYFDGFIDLVINVVVSANLIHAAVHFVCVYDIASIYSPVNWKLILFTELPDP